MKKLSKAIMCGSMAVLLLGTLVSCGGTGTTGDEPENKKPVNVVNLVANGNADDEDGEGEIELKTEAASFEAVEGGVTGNAWKVVQTGTKWCELTVDLTDVYGTGKSYLISAKVKNDPEATGAHKDAEFTTAWTLYSGDVKNWADSTEGMEYYDFESEYDSTGKIVSPWGGALDVKGEGFGIPESEFNLVDELSNEWQEIKFIINTVDIEKIVNNSGLYKFSVAFFAGTDGPGGYSFLIDDICVVDLNPELKVEGETWVDPKPKEPKEKPAEEDDDE